MMIKSAKTRRERQKKELRSELLAAAHALVQEEGYEGLTIRRLAKRVGYAPMSVYSYFADKRDILVALAGDAFQTLARRMEQLPADGSLETLRAVLVEYVAFGLENPNEYRTVFIAERIGPVGEKTFAEVEQGNPALRMLLERVEACVAAGTLKGDVRAISTILWTMGHGAVSLLITFPAYLFGDPQAYVARIADMAIEAVAAKEIPPLPDVRINC